MVLSKKNFASGRKLRFRMNIALQNESCTSDRFQNHVALKIPFRLHKKFPSYRTKNSLHIAQINLIHIQLKFTSYRTKNLLHIVLKHYRHIA